MQPLAPGDVLIRLHASGLCHTDLEVIEGALPYPLPIVLGHEGAGVFEQVGTCVTHVKPGDLQAAAHPPIGWCVRGRGSAILRQPPSPCEQVRAGTAPCQLPAPAHQQSRIGKGTHTPIQPPAHRRRPDPSSTTRAIPSARCCTAPWPVICRPGLRSSAPARSIARATSTPHWPM